MFFRAIPYFRYLLFFILGLLSVVYAYDFFCRIPISVIILFQFLLVIIYIFLNKKIFSVRYLIFPFFYVCGVLCVLIKTEKLDSAHLYNFQENYTANSGVIVSETEEKENTYKTILKVKAIKINQKWVRKKGKLFLYIFKKDVKTKPKYGDCLIVNGSADTISNPLNPKEFDFKQFYGFLQIHHRDFVSQNDYIIYDYQPENELVKLSYEIRAWAEKLFKTYISTEREQKIASALILGIKGSLDWEIMQAYASTGTMHVLAVSGLHVGIIYQILVLLCFWSKKIKNGNWYKAGFLLFLLWFYALITGLSPSVLRSVAMFTFIIVAEATNRKSNIYNTLAASCLFLLCINPYMIMEVGFQLSYLAVLGIVYVQPKLYKLLEIKEFIVVADFSQKSTILTKLKRYFLNAFYWILDWIWMISCVSVAAQLATFPLGILYFHQFPNYFLVSNLAVIPAALAIMYVGLSFVLFSYFEFWAKFTGFLIQFSVEKLNQFILFLEDLPFSVVRGISISILDTWHIYLILILFFVFLYKKHFLYFLTFFLLIFVFSINTCLKIIDQKQQKAFTIYAIPKGFGFDFFESNNLASYIDKKVLENPSRLQFHILNNRWSRGLDSEYENIKLKEKNGIRFYTKNGLKFAIIDQKLSKIKFKKSIKIDYLIIQNNSVWSFEKISECFDYQELVLDGTNSKWFIERFLKTIPKEKKATCKSLIQSGAINIVEQSNF